MNILNLLLANFISYSQCFEDFILFYLFYDIKEGFYIDVGANDPNIYSVTKACYQRGWYGINVEPLPDKFQMLVKERQRDINLQFGAGNIEGNASLMYFGYHGLSSSLFYNKTGNNSQILNITIKTMSNICKMYVPKGIKIQFCKIDVERAEKYVLLGYDFENYRPKVFCIETLININTNTPEYKEWEFILTKNDYQFAYYYKGNRFYYDNRIKGFKEKFDKLDFFVQKYKNKINNHQ